MRPEGACQGTWVGADLDLAHWLVFTEQESKLPRQCDLTRVSQENVLQLGASEGSPLTVSSCSQPGSLMKQNEERSIIGSP